MIVGVCCCYTTHQKRRSRQQPSCPWRSWLRDFGEQREVISQARPGEGILRCDSQYGVSNNKAVRFKKAEILEVGKRFGSQETTAQKGPTKGAWYTKVYSGNNRSPIQMSNKSNTTNVVKHEGGAQAGQDQGGARRTTLETTACNTGPGKTMEPSDEGTSSGCCGPDRCLRSRLGRHLYSPYRKQGAEVDRPLQLQVAGQKDRKEGAVCVAMPVASPM